MAEARNLSQFEAQARNAFVFASAAERLSGNELTGQTIAFRGRLASGTKLVDLMPEAAAQVREAARRATGMPHSQAQLAAGMAVHAGRVVEMKDGEGKTLTAVLAAYLHSLAGQGVHLVALDDQLARRGAEQADAVLSLLGLRVGVIDAGCSEAERMRAYTADVTYASYLQFGYDYLRDNLAWHPDERVQRDQCAAVLDEIDSILIDKATELLALNGRVEPDANQYRQLAQLAEKLQRGPHYSVDAAIGAVTLTERGVAEAEATLGVDGLLRPEHAGLAGPVADAIRARAWYRQGQDYVVIDGEVKVVGGRLSQIARFEYGIRQAIEASEGLHISVEQPALARISVAGYFRLYRNLAGLTATATAAAAEFSQNYALEVALAPAGAPTRRVDHSDLIYGTQRAKLGDLIRGVRLRHDSGQPVVIGAPSTEAGERISHLLSEAGIANALLSPRNADNASAVMAGAGGLGAVTVICGTSGRGYPVRLGGDSASGDLRQAAQAMEHERVIEVGGLAVLGSERNRSRRTDDWLRGLAGRRGEPGESRFLVAMDDPFMVGPRGGGFLGALRRSRPRPSGIAVTGLMRRVVEEHLDSAETRAVQVRRTMDEYEKVSDHQCTQTYRMRKAILEAGDPGLHARAMIDAAIEASVAANPDPVRLRDVLAVLYPVSLTAAELATAAGGRVASAEVMARVKADALAAYERREQELRPALLREFESKLMLGAIDREWREHLTDLDRLRELAAEDDSVNGDPLDEYRRSAAERYSDFLGRLRQRIVSNLFFLEIPR